MSVKVFIDGSAGTTGLRIADVWLPGPKLNCSPSPRRAART